MFYLCWVGGKIKQPGQLDHGGEDSQGQGQDIPGQPAPRGMPPGGQAIQGQDKLGHRSNGQMYYKMRYFCH